MNRPERFGTPTPPLTAQAIVGAEFRPSSRRDAAEISIIGLFVLALLVALHAAASIVVPMTAAVILGSVLAHIGDRAQRIGLPPLVAAMSLVVVTGLGLFFLGSAVADVIAGLVARAPELMRHVDGLLDRLLAPLAGLEAHMAGIGVPTGGDHVEKGLGRLASSFDAAGLTNLLGGLTPALGEVLIFLATLVFFVLGRATLRKKAILAFGDRDRRLAAIRMFNAAEAALATFFGTTAAIYACVGLATTAVAWIAGLSDPILWGVVTMLLSFVPFLGPAVVVGALVSAGLLAHDGLVAALWPAAAFTVVHLVCENAVIPSILGRRFEINPFLVFVAIVFWSWMWGAMGAVLAVPVLLIARAVREELREEASGCLPD